MWRRYRDQLRAEGRAIEPADRALMTACPLCGGAVSWCGFSHARLHAI